MKPFKILLIDDDNDDVQMLIEALNESGVYTVYFVPTALKAFMYLEAIQTAEDLPKLIITDFYLPGINGAQFLANLKKIDKYRDIKVVVLTSGIAPEEKERFRQLGALDYFEKPVLFSEYVQVAEKIKEKAWC